MDDVKYGKLRGRMAELGVTQEDIGQCLGITRQAVNKKFAGITGFSQKDILQICDFLDIPIEEIGLFFYVKEVLAV